MKYFLIAGEASGDMHGAKLMNELKSIDPEAEFCFLGGDLMLAEGGKMVQHYRDMAFMGIINVLKNLDKIAKNFSLCNTAIRDFKPEAVIFIDYPSFNLKVAKYAKTVLKLPTYYYIAPKLWVWKEYRIKAIKRYIDRMFVIFPFEVEYFAGLGYKVDYVGNPVAERVSEFLQKENNIYRAEKTTVALLAGSRKQEISKCLPLMQKMAKYFPEYQFVVAKAPGIDSSFYEQFLSKDVKVVENETYQLLRGSRAAIVNSGTATLETALLGTPQVVVYHVAGGKLVPLLHKTLLKVKYVSLVNLIAGREVVKELITPNFNEEQLRAELGELLRNDERRRQIQEGYREITKKLGEGSTSVITARKIVDDLNARKVKKC